MLPAWVRAPAAPGTEMLAVPVEELSSRADGLVSRRNVNRALVLGGMVLDGVPDEQRRRFLAGVPRPQRQLVRLLADRTYAKCRTELRGAESP